jgi:uncharacterized membrane protein
MLHRLLASLRSNILTGVLVLAPLGAVLWIVGWLWAILAGVLDLWPTALHPTQLFNLDNPIAIKSVEALATLAILCGIVGFFWFVGLVSRNYFGKKLLQSISKFVARVPVLSTVYSTLEQLLKTFGSDQTKNFRRVVRVEYPRKGLYTLALVTGERDGMLNIYVPTTPNPTSGFYLSVAANEVTELDITVEAALKEIISMGIVHGDKR